LKVLIVKADTGRSFDEYCGKYVRFVSDERRARLERMRSERDRITSLTAELTVRMVISDTLGLSNDEIFFDYGKHGKPFLRGHSDFHFSFSHAGEYVAFVGSDTPAGIDTESGKRGNEKIAKRCFTENEYSAVYERGTESFVRIWTCKEAYVKYLGTGLSEGLDTFDVLDGSTGCRFESFDVPGGYTATVCTVSDEPLTAEFITAEQVFGYFG